MGSNLMKAKSNGSIKVILVLCFLLAVPYYHFVSLTTTTDPRYDLFRYNDSDHNIFQLLTEKERAALEMAPSSPADDVNNDNAFNNDNSSGNINQQKQVLLTERPKKPIVIGYAISLVKCEDFQSSSAGLTDASIILQHSVHLTSIRNTQKSGSSVYDYKMFGLVHRDVSEKGCDRPLKDAGFHIIVVDPPIQKSDIQGDYLRRYIHKAWCCGADEFIKLHPYKMTDVQIIVHTDIDYIFAKPMDDLYDAMLYDKNSEIGRNARMNIDVEFPNDIQWPDNIQAFLTRDWPQVIPGRKPGYQAGFLVVKPNPQNFDIIVDVIKKGHYVQGYGRDNGWGGLGYGGFVGAMAMQGLLAYIYDVILPNDSIELNQCRYNHFGMDVLYRAAPSFQRNHAKAGQCRNDREYCEDCMTTDVSKIYNIHYNMCRKPWNCIGESNRSRPDKGKKDQPIPEPQVNYEHCIELMKIWHNVRTDLETRLYDLTEDETIKDGQRGEYKKDVFQGHCTEYGGDNYLTLSGKTESFQRIRELYEKES